MKYYAMPIGHTNAKNMIEEFSSMKSATFFCEAENETTINTEYECDREKWLNDEYAVEWKAFTKEELDELF